MDTRLPAAVPPPGPGMSLWLLRVLAVLLLLVVLAQPVLAGLYLSGQWDALGVHRGNAALAEMLSFLLVLTALPYWLAGRGRGRVVLATVALFVAVMLQAGFGYGRVLALHIPLGVTVVTATVLYTGWVCGRGGRTPRRPWRAAR